MNREHLDFVLGADVGIADLLTDRDVMPFLKQGLAAGLSGAQIRDADGQVLWAVGTPNVASTHSARLVIEGEPVGTVCCTGQGEAPQVAGTIIAGALNALLFSSLKRKLTTEVHTQAINQSYADLLDRNHRLAESEKRYRELAATLEVRVEERTRDLQQACTRLLQQEKLVSVGQLAAGVAHEINNPMGFILSNYAMLEKYVERFRVALFFLRERSGPSGEIEEYWGRNKLDLVLEDAVELIRQSREGGERIKKIVSDLRSFSHIDQNDNEPVDINQELERTLSVMAHETPADAEIIRDFASLPKIAGNPALLCQAFFNLIRNAFQCRSQGLVLSLATRSGEDKVVVEIRDNGPGIPEELQSRIFEPFFTTREVGQGMGLGLSLAYDVVNNAGGSIVVDSRPGEGSRFIVELPCRSENYVQVR